MVWLSQLNRCESSELWREASATASPPHQLPWLLRSFHLPELVSTGLETRQASTYLCSHWCTPVLFSVAYCSPSRSFQSKYSLIKFIVCPLVEKYAHILGGFHCQVKNYQISIFCRYLLIYVVFLLWIHLIDYIGRALEPGRGNVPPKCPTQATHGKSVAKSLPLGNSFRIREIPLNFTKKQFKCSRSINNKDIPKKENKLSRTVSNGRVKKNQYLSTYFYAWGASIKVSGWHLSQPCLSQPVPHDSPSVLSANHRASCLGVNRLSKGNTILNLSLIASLNVIQLPTSLQISSIFSRLFLTFFPITFAA